MHRGVEILVECSRRSVVLESLRFADLLRCCRLKLIDEFEYIPVQGGPFRIHIYNPTSYDPSIFVFDASVIVPPLYYISEHLILSIALMVKAELHLSSVTRLQSSKGERSRATNF